MVFTENVSIIEEKRLPLKPGPEPGSKTLKDMDPKKPGPGKTWTHKNLDPLKPGGRSLTQTLKNLDPEKLYPEKPGPRKTRTLKNLDPQKPGRSETWILKNLDPEKIGPRKTWTLKNLSPEKHGINIGLKNMSDYRELCFIKTIRNVIYCLKDRVLADI